MKLYDILQVIIYGIALVGGVLIIVGTILKHRKKGGEDA